MAKNTDRGILTLIAGSVASVSVMRRLAFVAPSTGSAAGAPSEAKALRGQSSAISAQQEFQEYALQPQFSLPGSSTAIAGLLSTGALGLASSMGKQRKCMQSQRRAFDASLQEGVTNPVGFFDPLGFTRGKDEKEFRKLRVAEIKHGRVAMMASIGMVMPHFFKAPGFEEVPAGLGAVVTFMGGAGFAMLVLGAGLHELVLWKDDESKDPGNFGDPFKFGESINVDRNYELNNGRMAMFAVLGQVVAELATGKDAVQQLGF